WVVALYVGVQGIENYLVTPIVEGRAVALPPALLIAAGVLLAVVFGVLGVLLSTPLTVALVVLVQALYVEDTLGDPVPLLGDGAGVADRGRLAAGGRLGRARRAALHAARGGAGGARRGALRRGHAGRPGPVARRGRRGPARGAPGRLDRRPHASRPGGRRR